MELKFSLNKGLASFGHRFILRISGDTLNETDRLALKELKPFGVILSKINFKSGVSYEETLNTFVNLIKDLKKAISRQKIFLGIEEEGGSFHQLPEPFANIPAPALYRTHATEIADIISAELGSLGINVLLGPVADVLAPYVNCSIGDRAFGDSVDEVTEAACLFSHQLMKNGIMPAPKHFPGEGGAIKQLEGAIRAVNLSEDEMLNKDLRPFGSLIDVGVPMILTSSLYFGGFDREVPAPMSRRVMHDLLRERLGFKGTIISGPLDAEHIRRGFADIEIIKSALASGCDLFQISDPEYACTLAYQIGDVRAVRMVSDEDLQSSFERIRALYEKLRPNEVKQLNQATFKQHQEIVSQLFNVN